MADVFISYKREDRPVVERLAGALQQLGFEVWWDFELLSGENFRKVIRAVIDQCRAAVVVWSRTSAESGFVLDEASYALRLGRLCPVRIDAVELPFGFGQGHVDDLSDWEGELSHPGFQALVKSIEDRVGRRARIGTGAVRPERQAAAAELDAFKAAQLAATVGALRSFVANFPGGVFASFVRDQIETMDKEKASRSRTRQSQVEAAATPAIAPAQSGGARRWRSTWIIGVFVAAVAIAGAVVYQQQERRAREAAEAAGHRAELERVAAERHAVELEAQAAADRAARERAEQLSEALRQKAEQERHAREQAARDQAVREQAARDKAARDQAVRYEAERKGRESAFSFDLLHRDVRAVVETARRNAREAEGAATRARTAAGLAEAAAQRAAAGIGGTISLSFDGGTYLGEGRNGVRNGYGVSAYRPPSIYAGDRFAGQYKDNVRNGVGVHSYASNANNTSQLRRREGEYASNRANGFGILLWATGEKLAGQWQEGLLSGPSVRTFTDGRRYEGDFVADKRSGFGVLWSADGRVISSGIWKDGKLVTAMAP